MDLDEAKIGAIEVGDNQQSTEHSVGRRVPWTKSRSMNAESYGGGDDARNCRRWAGTGGVAGRAGDGAQAGGSGCCPTGHGRQVVRASTPSVGDRGRGREPLRGDQADSPTPHRGG